MEDLKKGSLAKDRQVPPCQAACPIHQDVRGYLSAIASGDFDKAMRVIKETNPLPFICATICAHPCEDECRRKNADDALSIRSLKRAAVDFGSMPRPSPVPKNGEKVAIIGSGPSGLTAASDLACLGYKVTVFEKESFLGGALAQYVPLYRLPRGLIKRDIDAIHKMGVEFKQNSALGRDFTTGDLKKQGFKAILVCTGLPLSRSLLLPGFDMGNIYLALPFLWDVNFNAKRLPPGKAVIVIGGGNVAIDVARSALRAGAEKVKVACLESGEEMPAFPWEIEEAKEEGIEINCSCGPKCVKGKDGMVCAIETMAVRSVFDREGRFNPTFYEDRISIIEGDIVIIAIGQTADLSFLKGTEKPVTDMGKIICNPDTLATPCEGIFACGEVVTGPGMAVEAMANGRRAALSIHQYMKGEALQIDEPKPFGSLDECVISAIKRQSRQPMPLLKPEERVRCFDYIELGYTKEIAAQEARRCLSCGAGARRIEDKCIDCLTCVRICPYDVPIVTQPPDNSVQIREDQCQACGICVVECPALAIEFNSSLFEDMDKELEEAMSQKGSKIAESKIVLFYCYFGTYSIPGLTHFLNCGLPTEVKAVKMPCVSKLGVSIFLKAFELGADAVFILGCTDEDCIYAKAALWYKRHMENARRILKDLGLREEQIDTIEISDGKYHDLGNRLIALAQNKNVKEVTI
ncbi:FAD-dependent oxidoreductase [bacterium]|nr:FAD-dependent oxidoreductase [bacterium]